MITQSELKELLSYCPETGIFTWKKRRGGSAKKGSAAGWLSNGYTRIAVNGKEFAAHRLAWLYQFGTLPNDSIDHINHERSDNRISNLRECTTSDNAKNMSMHKSNSSGVTGVSWDKKTKAWKACIHANGRKINLGTYESMPDAEYARMNAEKMYGFHKNHGL